MVQAESVSPSAPKPKFEEGEKVLCFHGPLIYEAKCLKSSVPSKEKGTKYLIHYAGWNKNWDEWVPEGRVLKYNDANLQKQKELQKAHSMQAAKSKKSTWKPRKSDVRGAGNTSAASDDGMLPGTSGAVASTSALVAPPAPATETAVAAAAGPAAGGAAASTAGSVSGGAVVSTGVTSSTGSNAGPAGGPPPPSASPAPSTASALAKRGNDSGSDQPRKKRSRIEQSVESEEQYMAKVEVKVRIPTDLNDWLVDDWDMIVRQQKLVTLPAKTSVNQILDNFLSSKRTNKPANLVKESICSDIVSGLKEYFNALLGSMLLYKFERPQYGDILQEYPDMQMSQVYGAIHLLRMFVKIGSMLVYTQLDERNLQIVIQHIHEVLKYMLANRAVLFSRDDYGNATPDYHRKVQ